MGVWRGVEGADETRGARFEFPPYRAPRRNRIFGGPYPRIQTPVTLSSLLRATTAVALLGLGTAACVRVSSKRSSNDLAMGAASAATTDEAGWRPLFDGKSMTGWRGYQSQAVPDGWRVAAGILQKDKPVGDIISVEQFGDFEVEFEWRIAEGGNSGIFYRGTEEYDKVYWSATEYQLLDDEKAADGKSRLTSAGAAHSLYPSPAGHLAPVGQWNVTRIVAKGTHVEHWLNGFKLLEYEVLSADWEARVAASKFKPYPNYGRSMRGHFSIQGDHLGALAFRTIRVRELK